MAFLLVPEIVEMFSMKKILSNLTAQKNLHFFRHAVENRLRKQRQNYACKSPVNWEGAKVSKIVFRPLELR